MVIHDCLTKPSTTKLVEKNSTKYTIIFQVLCTSIHPTSHIAHRKSHIPHPFSPQSRRGGSSFRLLLRAMSYDLRAALPIPIIGLRVNR